VSDDYAALVAAQMAAIQQTQARPAAPIVDRRGPRCWACSGRGEVIVNRNHAAHPETAGWRPNKTWGAVACRTCGGTGLREGAGLCGECDEPIPDAIDALCVTCANLPRCGRCALRLDEDARDGELCCDCQRQDRIDFEINLGEL